MSTTQPRTATERRRERRLTRLLTASTLGVYLLIVLGAVTAVLDGVSACATWPACGGHLVVPLTDLSLLAAWFHRVATVAVGVTLLATAVAAWRHSGARIGRAVALAAGLYTVQIAIGAITVTTGAALPVAAVHLVGAMGIFTLTLVALVWHLDGLSPVDPGAVSHSEETDASTSTAAETTESDATDAPTATLDTPLDRVRAYVRLTKPRLMWLLCLVALAGMGLAGGRSLELGTVAATLVGGVLSIGASGVFNNVFEVERDREMGRTDDRPLVTGALPVRNAVAFGLALSAASVGTFLVYVNVLAAALGALAILFYSVGYTVVLKPNTSQNIVIGGAVGAFPALIGWAAVTNTVELPAIALGGVIFLWTPAHFYNLALAYRDDYAAGGFPMLPVVAGERTTRRHIALYLGATLLGAVLLGTSTHLGWLYAVTATVVGGVFLWAVVRLYREQTTDAAFRAFHASNAYLGCLLLAVVLDTLVV